LYLQFYNIFGYVTKICYFPEIFVLIQTCSKNFSLSIINYSIVKICDCLLISLILSIFGRIQIFPPTLSTMKRISAVILTLFCWTMSFAQDNTVVTGEIIIRFKNSEALQTWQQNTATQRAVSGIALKEVISPEMNLALMQFDATQNNLETVLTRCRQLATVQNAYPNYIAETRERVPDDAFYKKQWHLTKIKAPDAWDTTTGGVTANGDTIVIACLDSGFDVTHEDLKANIWKNRDEIAGDGKDNDGNGYIDDIVGWSFTTNSDTHATPKVHSTQIAGIIGASGNNAKGVSGVMWNTKMMVFSAERITLSEVIKAYEYVIAKRRLYNTTGGKRGAFVVAVSSSIGLSSASTINDAPTWCDIIDRLGSEGVLVAGATRNASNDIDVALDVPSACPSDFLITVTNGTQADAIAPNSGFGKKTIDLIAPGTNIFTTILNNGYSDAAAGTSFASPQVAGAIGLAYTANCKELATLALSHPAEAALIVKKILLESVDAVASLKSTTSTGGRLNVSKTLNSVTARCAVLTPTSDSIVNEKSYTFAYLYDGVQINFLEEKPKKVMLYNIQGQTIAQNYSTKSWAVNFDTLHSGIYIVTIETDKGLCTEKIVIR
jgi:subtilisin family serine protease